METKVSLSAAELWALHHLLTKTIDVAPDQGALHSLYDKTRAALSDLSVQVGREPWPEDVP
jgi:hypothetical protein